MLNQYPGGGIEEPATAAPRAGDVRQVFLRLRLAGLSTQEAGNLTAHLCGLRISGRPWTLAQIERLRFLRVLVATGRLRP